MCYKVNSINTYFMGSKLTDLQAPMTWEYGKCVTWYSPQPHFWDCNVTLNLPGGLSGWSGDLVFIIIKVWLGLSNSFTMCLLDFCWSIRDDSEYCGSVEVDHCCQPLIAKSYAVLKYVSLTNDDTDKCLVFFNMKLTDFRQIGSHMFSTFPPHRSIVPNFVWIMD